MIWVCREARRPGSSPLARGLPDGVIWHGGAQRIIPARAGFTRRPIGRRLHHWDHPRSRGVYQEGIYQYGVTAGSSPLARGLPVEVLATGGPGGIIPARAGFTDKPGHEGRDRGDHPRSRGVYPVAAVEEHSQPGSSPLARGLHDGRERVKNDLRIIPARAGFTRQRGQRPGHLRDHPRSRGVY